MILDIEQIKKFIPHRKPFLFLDKIVSIEHPVLSEKSKDDLAFKDLVGSKVTAEFFVSEDLEILRGHFPGHPILPGVVQTEMMAQAACFTVYDLVKNPDDVNLTVALLNVNNAKYRKPVLPGMNLVIESICKRVRQPIMTYECKISVDGEVVSESDILATVKM